MRGRGGGGGGADGTGDEFVTCELCDDVSCSTCACSLALASRSACVVCCSDKSCFWRREI